ncbi:MAG: radical SAM protein [SAR324 cluster bacterium]|uniref:Radical SAM protein n=1 Tax=SAR324 cluster bacterium TaxID=2024889 RepID=A0A2A4T5J1_9DELT|nr:MAG: radical SAM protein [SAR324 cluster bacterium]
MNTELQKTPLKPSRKGFITNYPAFRHWRKEAGENFLARDPLNIYVHIPFCIQRCDYCYYKTINLKGKDKNKKIDEYIDGLCKEIEMASKYFSLKDRLVTTIYFGGGTPTLLNGDQFHKIYDALNKNLTFSQDLEFTVEAEPVTLTAKKAEALKAMGVNRISMGVQSLHDDIIKKSNRLDTEKKVLKTIDIAKSTGASINIDLLSGMAGETQETWSHTIKRALSIDVESITIYKMELYANTEYYQSIRNDTLQLPSHEQELEFMKYALDETEQAEYYPWSFFTFTKQGKYPHIAAPSIWRGDDCYSFGVSSFGRMGDYLYQNTNELSNYLGAINEGKLPLVRGHYLTSLDQMVRAIQLELKLISFNLVAFRKKFGFSLESLVGPTLQLLVEEGYITLSEEELKLTGKGILYGDFTAKIISNALTKLK